MKYMVTLLSILLLTASVSQAQSLYSSDTDALAEADRLYT